MGKKRRLPPLPGPVLKTIFGNLSASSLRQCRCTCRLWNRVIIYYNLLPRVSDLFIHFDLLTKGRLFRGPSLSSTRFAFLHFITTGQDDTMWRKMGALQETNIHNWSNYFVRPNFTLTIVGFEEMKGLVHFLHPIYFPALTLIRTLHLEALDYQKCIHMELHQFKVFIRFMPNVQQMSLPLDLLSIFDPTIFDEDRNYWDCMKQVKRLRIELPVTRDLTKNDLHYLKLMTNVANLLRSKQFAALESLEVVSTSMKLIPEKKKNKKKKKKLTISDVLPMLINGDRFASQVATQLQNNVVSMVDSKLNLQQLILNIDGFPQSCFDHTGILSFFAFLAMRGLRRLSLKVEGICMGSSLATIIQTMIYNYGCEVELDLVLYFGGAESHVTNKYLLSLPEMFTSVKHLHIKFLSHYDLANSVFFLEDFVPFNVRLEHRMGQVLFTKLTKFSVQFEEPTSKVFLTFGWLKRTWPYLKEISIIIGHPSRYQSDNSIAWSFLKDKWKGRKSMAISNVFYLRSILKSFPKLESLVMWADLTRSSDYALFIVGPASDESNKFNLFNHVPELRKLSLRGVGQLVTNNCLNAFTEMKHLSSLELIGNHNITSTAKNELMKKVPSLKDCKIRL